MDNNFLNQNKELEMVNAKLIKAERESETDRRMLAKKTAELQLVEKIFTNGQLRKLKSTSSRILWRVEDIASSISLFSAGPRSYRLLRKRGYPLPGLSTLRRWAEKIDVKPGILTIILRLMENNSLSKMDKACVVLFDEMKIQAGFEYERKSDTTLSPSKYVQVIMARGLFGNWKQPIFYDFDCKITKELLFEIIKNLEHIGYPVYAINSDLGGSNRGLWTSLNISENKTWFENPATKKNIYVFADAPHTYDKTFKESFH
uniref:Transposable element P transposase-like RNase H domain-containing protein n=2 Tax=Photinus pyralis TaxID=7054 RepID=A0A1Y1KF34_PHOPY